MWIWSSNVQNLENLGLQTWGISRQQTPFSFSFASFYRSTTFRFAPGFVADSYHSHHFRQPELLVFSVQERMVTSWFFRSRSFFQFLTQCPTEAEICWWTFCQIRWSENGTWFYCLQFGDKAYPYMTSWNFLISRYGELNS